VYRSLEYSQNQPVILVVMTRLMMSCIKVEDHND